MSSPSFGDDEVYFGSVRVAFAKVPGTVVSFKSSEWRVDPASLPAVLERAKLQVSMGPSSTNFPVGYHGSFPRCLCLPACQLARMLD